MKKLSALALLSLSSVLCLPCTIQAQVPQFLHYQGRLLSGSNLVNGTVDLSLRLFNVSAGGTILYEDSNSVTVADGSYSTYIGDTPSSSSFLVALTNAEVWIEVAVNGTALAPRERLASVGYSLATRGLTVDTNGSAIFNPAQNSVAGSAGFSTVGGGQSNIIQAMPSFPGGFSVLGGGLNNTIQGAEVAVLVGGRGNSIGSDAYNSFLGGGRSNTIRADANHSFLGGGEGNSIRINTLWSFLGGGLANTIQSNINAAVLVGGYGNSIESGSDISFLGSGQGNSIGTNGNGSFIGSGENNSIRDATTAFIGAGEFNSVRADRGFLGGGLSNSIQADAQRSFIGAGEANTIGTGAFNAMIPGGDNNSIGGNAGNSFAAGSHAKANHSYTFVWSDGSAGDFASSGANQFLVRAGGGVGIGTAALGGFSLQVAGTAHRVNNSASWDTTSDRRLKTGIEPMGNALALLERVKPVNFFYTGEYLAANPGLSAGQQFGIIAQDFRQVFPDFVSTNREGYLTVNTSPLLFVNTAAIQELESEVGKLQSRNADLQKQNDEQQQLLLDLRARLEVLEQK